MSDFYEICTDFFSNFPEISATDFYRNLFPFGELQSRDESGNHKYNAIACEICKTDRRYKTRRFTVGNDLENLDYLLRSENFVVMAPMSYVGKARTAKNARYLYALTFDLDGIRGLQGLRNLFFQMQNDHLPYPTYVANSGNGLHLYYVFDVPVPMFPSVVLPLEKLKNWLTRHIWNRYVTKLCEERDVQYEPIWQGFRIVGGVTKDFQRTGRRVRCWLTGQPVSLEQLNRYVPEEYRMSKDAIQYKPEMTLEEAKEKYPDWYDRRILKKDGKRYWTVKTALYDWWLNRLWTEASVGHRYYCIMCLAIYAKKCGVSFDKLKADAMSLLDFFDEKTTEEDNHFTRQDILDGLKAYRDEFCTMPINSIVHFSGIPIEKNRRNGRTQKKHLQGARAIRDINNPNWREGNGRKSVEKDCYNFFEIFPGADYKEFCEKTGFKKSVYYKYKKIWKERYQDNGGFMKYRMEQSAKNDKYSIPTIAFTTDENGEITDSPMTRRSFENLRKNKLLD